MIIVKLRDFDFYELKLIEDEQAAEADAVDYAYWLVNKTDTEVLLMEIRKNNFMDY